jgi:TolB-like protein
MAPPRSPPDGLLAEPEKPLPTSAAVASPRSLPRLSLVVLPFVNLSGDPAQDYLADVITEGLTAYLSRIRGSFVIARTTAFTYKGKAVDVKRIGQELGVRYILEGSAQQYGTRVRVSAQLVDADRWRSGAAFLVRAASLAGLPPIGFRLHRCPRPRLRFTD